MHTNASTAASEFYYSALNFQGNLPILASLSIFKGFQMIEMHPDNAFHFFLIGLLSNKLLIISWGLQVACVPAAIQLPREQRDRPGRGAWLHSHWCLLSQDQVESITYGHRDSPGHRQKAAAEALLPMSEPLYLYLRNCLPALWG